MIANFRFPIADCRLSIVDCRLRGNANYRITRSPNYQIKQAFTLVEMVIVIGIIILLAGLVLPAASQMWRDRYMADAENMISGMLMTARARALEGSAGETGLFFYLDDQNVQRVAAISQDPGNGNSDWQTQPQWHNVFTVSAERTHALPSRMRVVPRYAVCTLSGGKSTCDPNALASPPPYQLFSDDELANNDFANPPSGTDVAQRQRNFFTIIYSPDGELEVGRDVLVRDTYDPSRCGGGAGLLPGDVTGLRVGTAKCNSPGVTQFYLKDPDIPYKSGGVGATVEYLVTDNSDIAINFPSVDGLLVYDDSLFSGVADAAGKRKYLLDAARPFYIHRLTGAVVRGPVGETPPVTP